ncbi:MAG: hypothetical protein IPM24_14910 [Bryobacterales bacterium]|nr:hypothetical protein [Bryobacterales bacterium]
MRATRPALALLAVAPLGLHLSAVAQQAASAGNDRFPGSAVVSVEDREYLIRIECRERGRPEAGFSTELNRVTRADTGGRSNMASLNLRRWQDSPDVVVSLDRYVAWLPVPTSNAGVLTLELAMSPASVVRNGAPTAVTYDMWKAGDRPPGHDRVRIVANCRVRDPAAPAFRKVRAGQP